MAGKGITKQIKLIATLDDSAFKRQISELKKSLGKDISFGGADLSELRNSFKSIAKEFSKELKDALSAVSKGPGKATAQGRSIGGFDKEAADSRIENKKLLEQETREKARQLSHENKERDKQLAKETRDRQRSLEKERRDKQRVDNTEVAKAMRSLGANPGTARRVSQAMDQAGSLGGTVKGGAALMNRLPIPAGVTAGMLGAAGLASAAASGYVQIRELQEALTQRRQAQSFDILRGRGLMGAVGKSGRSSLLGIGAGAVQGGLGGLAKGAAGGAAIGAGVGALFGGIGAVPGAAIGGAIGGIGGLALGAVRGGLRGGEEEAASRQRRVELAQQALDSARNMRQDRVTAMAGGGIGGAGLTGLQGQGTQFGFSPEETIQQFISARGSLGNKGAAGGLGTLQGLNRSVGLDVGEGARASEIFGGSSGTGMAAGVASIVEVLKKGVASGLDASKSGQFLKMTADFVQSQTGFAQLNPEDIADKLAKSAFQFSRGGEVSQVQLQQAQNLQEMVRQASGTTEGLAGGANIMSVMEEAQKAGISLDPMQLLALSRATNLGAGAISAIAGETGATTEQIQKFTKGLVGRKEQAPENMIKMLFGEGKQTPSKEAFALTEGEFGNYTEDVLGIMESRKDKVAMGQGNLSGAPTGPEMESLRAESKVNQTSFVEGLKLLGDDTKAVSGNLKTLTKEIQDAAAAMRNFAGVVSRDKR
jgi:hypothetical protein